jgi:NADP-dependent 3-hydroxy acid dehydrogenase YdfG
MVKLAGRVALVTGASRGIGRAIAVALAREGACVTLAARTQAELDTVACHVAAAGGRALPVVADVTCGPSVDALLSQALGEFARIDLLVTAAGVASFGRVVDRSVDDWDAMLAVNLRGVILTCRAVLPVMTAQGAGTIINVASIAATRAIPGAAVYSATKAGVLAFSRVLAEEVRAAGIRVGVLVPGAVDTPLWDAIEPAPERARMLRPEDVAEAAVLMAALPPRATLEELTLLPAGGIL